MKVELRKWTMDDCARMAEICTLLDRSYLSDQLPDPYTEDSAAWWINMALEKEGKEGVFRAILADGTVVGNISVERKQDVYRQDAEIGYFLLTERWSKGIMTEAVRKICQEAFEQLDIIRITGLVYAPNIASRRVLEKNGFEVEGVLKNGVLKNGAVYDLCIYGKQKEPA